jgi:3-deoxy-D-manno-octulosonic-acid transferase
LCATARQASKGKTLANPAPCSTKHASVIFVGKSLTAEGGQSPIEPGILGKAMVFGPNMQNFPAIASAFVERKGAVQVRDAIQLERTLEQLLADPEERDHLGRNAVHVVRENQGSIERTVDMILPHLESEEVFVTSRAD